MPSRSPEPRHIGGPPPPRHLQGRFRPTQSPASESPSTCPRNFEGPSKGVHLQLLVTVPTSAPPHSLPRSIPPGPSQASLRPLRVPLQARLGASPGVRAIHSRRPEGSADRRRRWSPLVGASGRPPPPRRAAAKLRTESTPLRWALSRGPAALAARLPLARQPRARSWTRFKLIAPAPITRVGGAAAEARGGMDQRLSPPGCVEIAQRGVEIGAFAPPPAVDPASFEAAGEGVLSGGAGACRGSGTLDWGRWRDRPSQQPAVTAAAGQLPAATAARKAPFRAGLGAGGCCGPPPVPARLD